MLSFIAAVFIRIWVEVWGCCKECCTYPVTIKVILDQINCIIDCKCFASGLARDAADGIADFNRQMRKTCSNFRLLVLIFDSFWTSYHEFGGCAFSHGWLLFFPCWFQFYDVNCWSQRGLYNEFASFAFSLGWLFSSLVGSNSMISTVGARGVSTGA